MVFYYFTKPPQNDIGLHVCVWNWARACGVASSLLLRAAPSQLIVEGVEHGLQTFARPPRSLGSQFDAQYGGIRTLCRVYMRTDQYLPNTKVLRHLFLAKHKRVQVPL